MATKLFFKTVDGKYLSLEKAVKPEDKIHKVMREFKAGTLKSSSGQKVTDRSQAIAIAMSESGLSKQMVRDILIDYDDMEKARITKYVKRVPKPSGKGYYYFYTKQQFQDYKDKGIVPKEEKGDSALQKIFKFLGVDNWMDGSKKIGQIYEDNKSSLLNSDIDKKTFSEYSVEYLQNKEKWDAKFLGEKKEKGEAKPKSEQPKSEKKESTGASGQKWNTSIMRTIAGIYGGGEKEKSVITTKKELDNKLYDNVKKFDSENTINVIIDKYSNDIINTKVDIDKVIADAQKISKLDGEKYIKLQHFLEAYSYERSPDEKFTDKDQIERYAQIFGQEAADKRTDKSTPKYLEEKGDYQKFRDIFFKKHGIKSEKDLLDKYAGKPEARKLDEEYKKGYKEFLESKSKREGSSDNFETMPEERKRMAQGQKKIMSDLSLKINLLESQKRKVESNPEKYYGENPWDELKRLKKEYEDAKERYEYWESDQKPSATEALKTFTIVDNNNPERNVKVQAKDENEAKDKGASELKTTNIRTYESSSKIEALKEELGKKKSESKADVVSKFVGKYNKSEYASVNKHINEMLSDTINETSEQSFANAIKQGIDIDKSIESKITQFENYTKKLTDAIESKDYDTLSRNLHTGNKNSRKIFKEITGVDLGKTMGSTDEALKKFVGEDKVKALKDELNKKQEEKAKSEKDTREAEEKAKYAPLGSFGDTLSGKDKGLALSVLTKKYNIDGKTDTLINRIDDLMKQGWGIGTSTKGTVFHSPKNSYIELPKTALKYIEHNLKESGKWDSSKEKDIERNKKKVSLEKNLNNLEKEYNKIASSRGIGNMSELSRVKNEIRTAEKELTDFLNEKEIDAEPKKEEKKTGSAQEKQEEAVIKALKDSYKNKSERQLKELLKPLKENPEHNSLRIKAIEEIIKPKSAQAKYDQAKTEIKQFEDEEKKSDFSPEEWQAYLKEADDYPDSFSDEWLDKLKEYRESIKNLSKFKEDALDEAGQGKMFKALLNLREELLFKAAGTKYIKKIPNPKGKGYIYFYTPEQVKAFQKDGTLPDQKKEGEEKKPESDKKQILKDSLKKIASIFSDALSGKDTVQPTGSGVEQAGEKISADQKAKKRLEENKKKSENKPQNKPEEKPKK